LDFFRRTTEGTQFLGVGLAAFASHTGYLRDAGTGCMGR
jgi:hypothetical protein